MMEIHPIYVGCHTCHADPGQPCRDGGKPMDDYHGIRVRLAKRCEPVWMDTVHALAHGKLCEGHKSSGWEDLCVKCGANISRLRAIPDILNER